jgi:hypothetical protein
MVTHSLGTARGLKILVSVVGLRRCLGDRIERQIVTPLERVVSE